MSKINCLPDLRSVEINKSDTVLEALLANGIEHTNICGGNAHCSTCRIVILEGVKNCISPTSAERALAKQLDFPVHVRLACPLFPPCSESNRTVWWDYSKRHGYEDYGSIWSRERQ